MARKKTSKKKGNVRTVDMSDVESGGLVPEGSHVTTITEVEIKVSENSGAEYVAFKAKTDKGPLYWNCSLQPQALFNLRGLLEACDFDIPDGPQDIDFDELVGCEFIAVVEHEKYEGRLKARVVEYLSADEDIASEETEEDDEEEDDEEDEADEDEEADDEDEEEDEEEDDEEEDEVEAEDDDEELDKISEDELAEMDLDDLAEVVEKYGLDVNLKKAKTAKKKLALVHDALEEAGYLED